MTNSKLSAKKLGNKQCGAKKGFTIIEVVLVLAIAGLIFLMVFIALPALQRSQKNTSRKSDLERIVAAINSYQSNNNGKTPFDDGKVDSNFVKRYIDSSCNVQKALRILESPRWLVRLNTLCCVG